jgi:hypothetical protein
MKTPSVPTWPGHGPACTMPPRCYGARRYQIYGCAQDELPWSAVGELAARMTAQPGMAFVDANAALALAAARDEG